VAYRYKGMFCVNKTCSYIDTKAGRLLERNKAYSQPAVNFISLVSSTATFSLSSIEFRLVTNKTVESAEDFADDDSYDSYASEPEIPVDETQHAISSFGSISSLMLPRAALETATPETLESIVKSQSFYWRKRDTTRKL
jgi:hypothetical protein